MVGASQTSFFSNDARTWDFLLDGRSVSVDISETNIAKDAIARDEVRVGDTYKVKMKELQYRTPKGQIRTRYKILEVLEFRQGSTDPLDDWWIYLLIMYITVYLFNIYLQGMLLGLALIMVIGSQNAFILQQGLKNRHVFMVVLTCALSDTILIMAGIYSLQRVEATVPLIADYAKIAGAIYLAAYGFYNLYAAFFHHKGLALTSNSPQTKKQAFLTCLAFTWLNPHVYLDTFFLVGSVGISYGDDRLYFGLGAVSGSFLFFFSLGFIAKKLSRFFTQPKTWKILDFIIGLFMLFLAVKLLF